MDWADTQEQASFRADVRAFIEQNLPDFYRKKREWANVTLEDDWQNDFVHGSDEAKAAAKEWAAALSERNWVAPHWPPEYGGGGMSTMEQFIYNQEMAEAEAPLVGGQGSPCSVRRCWSTARRSRRKSSSLRRCAARCCGRRASPSPAPARTSRGCRRGGPRR